MVQYLLAFKPYLPSQPIIRARVVTLARHVIGWKQKAGCKAKVLNPAVVGDACTFTVRALTRIFSGQTEAYTVRYE